MRTEQELQERIKEIKKELRLSMNGYVSNYMREHGSDYKLNFGVETVRLKEISKDWGKEIQLSIALWKENIRECKILAIYLFPSTEFDTQWADLWIEDIPSTEIAELLSKELLSQLPNAAGEALRWIASQSKFAPQCGYLVLSRIYAQGNRLNKQDTEELIDQLLSDLSQIEEGGLTDERQQTAFNCLLQCVRADKEAAQSLLQQLYAWKKKSDILATIYAQIKAILKE